MLDFRYKLLSRFSPYEVKKILWPWETHILQIRSLLLVWDTRPDDWNVPLKGTRVHDMVMWYRSADSLFWQVSIDHNLDVQYQRSTHVSFNLFAGGYSGHLVRLHRCAYTPTSSTASDYNNEKIHWWVLFSFLYEYGAALDNPSGFRSSSIK